MVNLTYKSGQTKIEIGVASDCKFILHSRGGLFQSHQVAFTLLVLHTSYSGIIRKTIKRSQKRKTKLTNKQENLHSPNI